MLELTIEEGKPLCIPDGFEKHKIHESLLRLSDKLGIRAFKWKGGQLYAAEVVGCIQTHGIRINILPKLDTPEEHRDKNFLYNLLHEAGFLEKPKFNPGSVRKTSLPLLEVIISNLIYQVEDHLADGVPRRYESNKEDSQSPKGKIDIPRLSSRAPGNSTVPIIFNSLSPDNRLSQIVVSVLDRLYTLTKNNINRQRLSALLSKLSGIKKLSMTASSINTLKLSSSETHWESFLNVAKMFFESYAPDPTFSGQGNAINIIFKMEHLFERTMRNIISEALRGSAFSTTHRSPPLYLFNDATSNQGIVRLKPDYLLKKGNNHIAVADAKWKRLSPSARAFGVERDDLYQISSYLERYKVSVGIFFVPQAPWMSHDWAPLYTAPNGSANIYFVPIDLETLLSRSSIKKDSAYKKISKRLLEILN